MLRRVTEESCDERNCALRPAGHPLRGPRDAADRAADGRGQTPETPDFCGTHGITSDVEVIPIRQVNEAYERMLRGDVKYRFSIDMASLRS